MDSFPGWKTKTYQWQALLKKNQNGFSSINKKIQVVGIKLAPFFGGFSKVTFGWFFQWLLTVWWCCSLGMRVLAETADSGEMFPNGPPGVVPPIVVELPPPRPPCWPGGWLVKLELIEIGRPPAPLTSKFHLLQIKVTRLIRFSNFGDLTAWSIFFGNVRGQQNPLANLAYPKKI